MTSALYRGAFDPPTLGHLDLVRRAHGIFSTVVVGVAHHPTKRAWLSLEERLELWAELLDDLDGARAVAIEGLVVNAARENGCDVLMRGLRSSGDLADELPMAGTNRLLDGGLDTVFLPTTPGLSHVRATLVRQIAQFGGDVSALVPPSVAAALARRGNSTS